MNVLKKIISFVFQNIKRRDFFDRKNLMAYQILKQFEYDSLAL